ncbi:MAG: FKBP-type peptidyl-prolyl cis-trans isomerase [Bacteroidales bacterium]|nr:FKBP-type peptidyl-prolyl cis-trans isomerase [Bacteroidales bacterium]
MFKGDIYEGLAMMTIGDTASFIVRTDSTFYTLFNSPVLPKNIGVDDIMKFEVKLNDFYPESELSMKQIGYIKEAYPEETIKAKNDLDKYLKDNNINVTPTETGLYYVKIKDGNGERPQNGTEVKVHYTGKLLDGTVFDSSLDREPFQFELGLGQVIRGWDEGIQLMSKGEKGVLYIPFYLAYVDRQAGIIPPFSNLIFEVELLDF